MEPGCEFYTLNEEVTGKLIYIEAWTTQQHWLDHMEEPTVAEIFSGVADKLEHEVEVYEMYNLPTGVSGKGTLGSSDLSLLKNTVSET
jgi:quinol monooxygenase YgiN